MLRFMNLLLILWLLTSCQSMGGSQVDTPLPAHIFCDQQVAWSAEIDTSGSIDYTTLWIAFELETALDRFAQVRVGVTLDGEAVTEEMKFKGSAEPYHVICTDSGKQFDANRLKYTLFLPSLPQGEHTIVWTITIEPNSSNNNLEIPLIISKQSSI